jgi:hypothetical protein
MQNLRRTMHARVAWFQLENSQMVEGEGRTGDDAAAGQRAEVAKLRAGASRRSRVAQSFGEAQGREVSVRSYLMGLSRLCAEVSRDPRLLPEFLLIILRVPSTLAGLGCAKAKRRIAA